MLLQQDNIYNMDCYAGIQLITDNVIDLVIMDPPYLFRSNQGGGAFGTVKNNKMGGGRMYRTEIQSLTHGISNDILIQCARVCKIPNMYIFCNKDQLPQYLNFAIEHKLNFDILTWHKTNPVPACGNKYLSDTEYIVFIRGKGAKLYGTFASKRKYFLTPTNTSDKKLYGHPTCKPLPIIETLITNSTLPDALVLDPFSGSGTTAVASIRTHRHFLAFELNPTYHATSLSRLTMAMQ